MAKGLPPWRRWLGRVLVWGYLGVAAALLLVADLQPAKRCDWVSRAGVCHDDSLALVVLGAMILLPPLVLWTIGQVTYRPESRLGRLARALRSLARRG